MARHLFICPPTGLGVLVSLCSMVINVATGVQNCVCIVGTLSSNVIRTLSTERLASDKDVR